MTTTRTTVLDPETAKRKIERIAWEIYERHIDEDTLHLVGIADSGYVLAEKIEVILKRISSLNVELIKLSINKKNPSETPGLEGNSTELNDANVVIIDDVLNSGHTLIYAVRHILDSNVKRCTTAVLVDRNHKRFPIKADVKGVSLSTSMQEHVEVEYNGEETTAYLI